jgi:hypothetical protein
MARQADGATERVWRERLERQRGSGLSISAFCEHEGVSTASFYRWRRQLTAQNPAERGRAALFVPVAVRAAAGVRIELPGGAVVHVPAEADAWLLQSCIRAAGRWDGDAEGRPC